MRINNISNIPFQKKVVAICRVGEPKKSKKVYIYELTDKKDKSIISGTYNDPSWNDSYYNTIISMLYSGDEREKKHFYAMQEANSGKIMCLSMTDERWPFFNTLELIETAPKLSRYNLGQRDTKFIGQTMISYIAKRTKMDRKNLRVSYVENRPLTNSFYYDICKFNHFGTHGAIMKHGDLDSMIETQENLTGSKINLTS